MADLQVQFIQFALSGTLPRLFVLELLLKLVVLRFESSLLSIERLDLLLELLLVRAGDVKLLDRMLHVLHPSALLFIERSSL